MEAINEILSIIPVPVAVILCWVDSSSTPSAASVWATARQSKIWCLTSSLRQSGRFRGTKRGAERKAWCVKMLRLYLDNSKLGRLVSWAITEETMSKVIQFFFDRAKAALQKQ